MRKPLNYLTPLLTLVATAIIISACEKIEDLLRFSFSDSVEIVIPAQSIIPNLPIKIITPDVSSSSQQAFANNNTQAKYVKEANLTKLSLTITAPEGQTFDFLNEIEIYISAEGAEEVLIASATDIPEGVTALALETSGVNLKPYIQGDTYNIRTSVVVDEVTSREITIDADMTFGVTAEVF